MSSVPLDTLFMIAEESPLLDRLERALEQRGYKHEAAEVNKLQQDAGVEIARQMSDDYDPAAGVETARLDKAYLPITDERLANVMHGSYSRADLLTQADVKPLMQQLGYIKSEIAVKPTGYAMK